VKQSPRLEGRGLCRSFPGVKALDGVDIGLDAGEVLAVIGENGAGKSTLMKLLAGLQKPDSGQLLVDSRPISLQGPKHAAALGIALIHQELNLAGNLSIGANIYLGREPRRMGLIDRRSIRAASAAHLDRVGLDLDPDTAVERLPIGQQQLVEIAKALAQDARFIIMDEPTSSLSQTETERLFEVISDLRRRQVGVIYISHRLGEVTTLADRVEVLRDGRNAGSLSGTDIGHDSMVRLMVGRDLSQFYTRHPHPPGPALLSVEGLVTPAWPQHSIDFKVHQGEIVGLAGLVGAGRTELLQAVFGIAPPVAGHIRLGPELLDPTPAAAIAAGLALVPEDRKNHGLILDQSVRDNIGLAGLNRHRGRWGLVDRQRENLDAEQARQRLAIKTPNLELAVRYLSGGNQQKVVLGKWLALGPQVLLLDEPTRGVDIGAKREIYALMDELAAAGVAIVFASSEMEEILGMSDRILVMHEGRINGQLARGEFSEEAIMRLATGQRGANAA
jgi:ribose transport system ATP-binding protein